jgi:hypothetical protein
MTPYEAIAVIVIAISAITLVIIASTLLINKINNM